MGYKNEKEGLNQVGKGEWLEGERCGWFVSELIVNGEVFLRF